MSTHIVGLLGILIALGLLIFLAFRGFTLLLAAPAAAIVAAIFSGEPLLAKWTITFMQGTARFIANFFPLFLLGGVFGKLMDDSGAALSIAPRHYRKTWKCACSHGGGPCLRSADVWRRQPVRRRLRGLSGGRRVI
jgi:H+/gluconate symporter-like permease